MNGISHWRTMTVIVFGVAMFGRCAAQSTASQKAPIDMVDTSAPAMHHPNSILGSVGTVFFSSVAEVAVERRLAYSMSLRFGYCWGFVWETESTNGWTGSVQVQVGDRNMLEIGLGVAHLFFVSMGEYGTKGWETRPTVSLGYRYEPNGAWLCIRTGASYMGSGVGAYISLGLCVPDPRF